MNAKLTTITLLLLAFTSFATADVRLPKIFGDHMVLQRDRPISIWGWAEDGEQVSVSSAANRTM